MEQDVLTCSVCLNGYNASTHRPFDLGCGHSFCEQCIKTSPRSFRNCPECRARASNPHANIALLRLLDALDGTAGQSQAAGGAAQRPQQQQQQPQPHQQRQHQPTSVFGPGGVFRGSTGTSTDPHPVGSLGQMLNQVTAAIPAVAAAGSGGGSGSGNQNAPVVALPGSLATHKANIAQMRTSMWLYLTPLLGMLYILSPLDIIPDFLPLVGWIDDALVLYYVVCSLYQLLRERAAPPRA